MSLLGDVLRISHNFCGKDHRHWSKFLEHCYGVLFSPPTPQFLMGTRLGPEAVNSSPDTNCAAVLKVQDLNGIDHLLHQSQVLLSYNSERQGALFQLCISRRLRYSSPPTHSSYPPILFNIHFRRAKGSQHFPKKQQK